VRRFLAAILASAGMATSPGLAQQASPPASEPAEPPPASVWGGAYTEEQSKRGEEVYRQECASCHGPQLTGGEEAKPLTGADFTSNWNGLSVGDLFERIRVSMPPKRIGRINRQQIADVLAFIFSVNKFPAGKTELARDTDRLRLTQFEATRPASDAAKP
jgi:mono/diheme cytochrome c family protein